MKAKSKSIPIPTKNNMFTYLNNETPESSPNLSNNSFMNKPPIAMSPSLTGQSPTFSDILKLQEKINKQKNIIFPERRTTLLNDGEIYNIDNFDKLKFSSSWDIWFHIDPDDWTINSYDKLWNITSFADYYNFFFNFDLIEEAKLINLFMFRKNILPTWEDNANSRGACLSIKVNDVNNGHYLFNKLCSYILTESLIKSSNTNTHDYNGMINGISLNMKRNSPMGNQSVIIKIWLSDFRYAKEIYQKNLLNTDISKIINFHKCSLIYQAITPNNK
jgi:hypothetical protein